MRKRLLRHQLLFPAVFLATFLLVAYFRFSQLGKIPGGLTKDEAYYGYDAYSILKTGRDLWGQRFPLTFKSTGEYKLNLTYLMVPAIRFLGLNERAIRTPSAVFGFLTLFVLFATLHRLFRRRYLALLLTVIFAFSPWTFGLSRLFFESNSGLFFFSIALYLLLFDHPVLAAIPLGIGAYLYSAYRYIGFTLLCVSSVLRKKKLRLLPRSLLLYLLVISPLLLFGAKGVTTQRLREEWLLRRVDYQLKADDMRATCFLTFNSQELAKLCYPFWNKVILHFNNVARAAFVPFTPSLLFLENDNEYIIPREYGMYLSFLLPFYLLGLIAVFGFVKQEYLSLYQRRVLLSGMFIAALIVASPGRLEFYRHPFLFYLLFLVISLGFFYALKRLSRESRLVRAILFTLVIVVGLFQQTKYLLTYFLYTPKLPLLFSTDVRQLYQFVESKRDYDYIVDRKFHGPLTAAFLWEIDPAYFQANIVWTDPDPWGFINAYRLGNIYSQTYTVDKLLCLKHQNPSLPLRAVVIDDPGVYEQWASFLTKDYSGSLTLHAVYDIDELYDKISQYAPWYLCSN